LEFNMTKFSLGLAALAFAALTPLAAEASVQKAPRSAPATQSEDCKVSSNFTFCNDSQIGQVSKSYQLFDGGDRTTQGDGAPVLKVLVPNPTTVAMFNPGVSANSL
jgi:hypothetical protein